MATLDIPRMAEKVAEMIESDGHPDDIVRAIADGLRIVVGSDNYRQPIAELLADAFEDARALAFIARIKMDFPALEPLEYHQLGIFVRKIGDDAVDLSRLYLVLGGNWIDLGTPIMEPLAGETIH